ncbi:hypothetical protein NDU88_002877 [Pleurodeles waltl]|uniref:Uncharacterized protein n=1 Tax=Pleurodeles waltl TaxID=8319 RepID=A0AAV7SF72_PLEWA|nr:hypothetical protein NDU88_002877 [Pleurodeles waltl]
MWKEGCGEGMPRELACGRRLIEVCVLGDATRFVAASERQAEREAFSLEKGKCTGPVRVKSSMDLPYMMLVRRLARAGSKGSLEALNSQAQSTHKGEVGPPELDTGATSIATTIQKTGEGGCPKSTKMVMERWRSGLANSTLETKRKLSSKIAPIRMQKRESLLQNTH